LIDELARSSIPRGTVTRSERGLGSGRQRTEILGRGRSARNQCLSRFITRFGARICDLRAEGYDFTTSFEGGDYIYTATKMPAAEQMTFV
jgi:hypothetical protein